uniref:Uncharacterized protein n=1 Tax=Manihot esculenta TaxID=3983 RepID=A0A2C9ULY7_MANES
MISILSSIVIISVNFILFTNSGRIACLLKNEPATHRQWLG